MGTRAHGRGLAPAIRVPYVPEPFNEGGSSLPEVCIAAGLLATAAVTLSGLFALAGDANRTAADLTHAAMLARHTLETLRSPAGEPMPPDGSDTVDRAGRGASLDTAPVAAVFERRWTSASLPTGATMILVEVTSTPGGRRQPVRVRVGGLSRTVP